jgi:hypothetical protein
MLFLRALFRRADLPGRAGGVDFKQSRRCGRFKTVRGRLSCAAR